ncbi:hypothetical protein O181_101713 [Austropuccinia psidii MF-1]|uniref:Reverse transcriptase Ty1/copia-type domain-containing protein n=1 Tax=Austropuccinia psidii MF-1 TaxID=1389203 RepID=A0A9Q3JEZ6_9BASI|nr:hypothetical protein [Austropuccinia psidii MF-1]
MDTVSRNTDPDQNTSPTIHHTPDAPIRETVILSPVLDQSKPDPPSSTAQDLLVATPNLPVHKGYSWILEHEINSPQEIFGNVGDPKNIVNHPRQPKHHANLAEHLSLDPKTYLQGINSTDGEEWMKAINSELTNMAKHQVWSPVGKLDHIKPTSTTWVCKRKTDEKMAISLNSKLDYAYEVSIKKKVLTTPKSSLPQADYLLFTFTHTMSHLSLSYQTNGCLVCLPERHP